MDFPPLTGDVNPKSGPTRKAAAEEMPMFSLSGQTALVIGASRGIGASIAEAIARQGANVAIAARSVDGLAQTRKRVEGHGMRALSVPMDVTDIESVASGVEQAVQEFGHLDILVSSAGINQPAPALQIDLHSWDRHFAVNVRGSFFAAQTAARHMMKAGYGRIIFISSQSGISAIRNQTAYCATKAALNHLARSLGVEWAQYGITVNAIAPTFIDTALTRDRLAEPEYRQMVLGKIPSGKLAQLDDVAAAAVFLASREAGMVNASVLSVDGGWTAW